MSWKTTNARRPDLEALEVNAPYNYIGGRVYPVITRTEKTGTLYYNSVRSDIAAQSGRNGSGPSITRSNVSSAYTTYSCGALYARPVVRKEEVSNVGGIEVADRIGGTLAKRSIMKAIEAAQAAALFTGDAHAVGSGEFFDAIAEGCKAVRKVYGTPALALGFDTYRYIMGLQEVTARLAFTGLTPAERVQVLSLKPELLKDMFQQLFGVSEILIGDSDVWDYSSNAGKAAIVKLPDITDLSYKLNPELGKTVSYQVDGSPFEIESAVDEGEQENLYTATAYIAVKELNASGKYILSGLIDEASGSGSASASAPASGSGE
jgi:hypothetical protein